MSYNYQKEEEGAGYFIERYNHRMGTHFQISAHQDSPDFLVEDPKNKEKFSIEVTLFHDLQEDIIQDQKLISPEEGFRFAHVLTFNEALPVLKKCIEKKFLKDYGPNCALVLYHNPGRPWSDDCWEQLKQQIDFSKSSFDRGIWYVGYGECFPMDNNNPATFQPCPPK